MTKTRRSRHAALSGLILAVALSFGLAACSGAPDADTASETTKGASAKYGACMRDAGFPMDDPSDESLESGAVRAPSGVDQEAFQKAVGTCRKAAGVTGASNAEQQKWEREFAKVASCIRDNGYPDFPEQKPGVLDVSNYPRAEEPGFQKVAKECTEKHAPDTKGQQVG